MYGMVGICCLFIMQQEAVLVSVRSMEGHAGHEGSMHSVRVQHRCGRQTHRQRHRHRQGQMQTQEGTHILHQLAAS